MTRVELGKGKQLKVDPMTDDVGLVYVMEGQLGIRYCHQDLPHILTKVVIDIVLSQQLMNTMSL